MKRLVTSLLAIVIAVHCASFATAEPIKGDDAALYGSWAWSGGDLLDMFVDFGFDRYAAQACTFDFYPDGIVVLNVPVSNLGAAQGVWYVQNDYLYVYEEKLEVDIGAKYEVIGNTLSIYSQDGFVTTFKLKKRLDGDTRLYSYRVLENGTAAITGYRFDNSIPQYELNIPAEIDGYVVTMIDRSAFAGAYSLTRITFPETVETIGDDAFANCTKLAYVRLPNSLRKIGENAFSSCVSLKTISLPASITSIGNGAFGNCIALARVTLPDDVVVDKYIFNNCLSLTRVELPKNMAAIPEGMFMNCAALNTISLPDGLKQIDSRAFYNCTALTALEANEQLLSIGYEAFANCTSLQQVWIWPGIQSIEPRAFANCFSLFTIGGVTPRYVDADEWIAKDIAREGNALNKLAQEILQESQATAFRSFSDYIVATVEEGDASIVSKEIYQWLTNPAKQVVDIVRDEQKQIAQELIKSILYREIEGVDFKSVQALLKDSAGIASFIRLDAEMYSKLFSMLDDQGISAGNADFAAWSDNASGIARISGYENRLLTRMATLTKVAQIYCESQDEWEQMVMYAALEDGASRYLTALKPATSGCLKEAVEGVENDLNLAVRNAFLSIISTGRAQIGEVAVNEIRRLGGAALAKGLFKNILNAWSWGGKVGALLTRNTGEMMAAHDDMYYLNLISKQIESFIDDALDAEIAKGGAELLQLYCVVQDAGNTKIKDYENSYDSSVVASYRRMLGAKASRQLRSEIEYEQTKLQEQSQRLNLLLDSYRYNCSLPDTLISLGSEAFVNCTSLDHILLPTSLKKIDVSSFAGCTNLTLAVPIEAQEIMSELKEYCNLIVLEPKKQDAE